MDRKPVEHSLSSILETLGSWFHKPQPARRPTRRARSLGLETLEGRRVMTAAPGAEIQGYVYNDTTGSSMSGQGIPGATVSLYQDNGADIYNPGAGDDTLIGTTTTNYQGQYTFASLAAGTYWVVETSPAAGYVAESSAPQKVVVTSAATQGTVTQTIDSFSSSQSVTVSNLGQMTSASTIAAPDALGGYRNIYEQLTSSYGESDIESNAWSQGLLEYNSSATGAATRYVAWDGNNSANPAVVNYTGLGGVDLTDGGKATGVEFQMGADHDNGTITIVVYKDAGDYSMATVTVPNTGGAATGSVFVPFNNFTLGAGSGANFSDVGAVVMKITGNSAVNGQITAVLAVGPTTYSANFANYQPASVGTFAFLDENDDGLRDNGDPGVANVSVQLLSGNTVVATTTTNSQGDYSFNGLAPGSYSVKFSSPNGSSFTSELVGSNPAINSDVNPSNGVSPTFTLTSGQNLTTVDAGILPIDLTVTKNVSNPAPQLDSNVTFTINLSNATGYSQATRVAVSDLLPAGLTYVSSATSQGTYNSSTGLWTVGSLAAGSSATLTVVATVATVGAKTNVATVTAADETDVATAAQLTSSAGVNAVLPVDLVVTKNVSNATPAVGSNVTFTITLADNGPGNATNVDVTDLLPAGLTYVSSTASQGTYNSSTGVWTVGSVASGATPVTLSVTTTVTTSSPVTNTATVTTVTQIDTNPNPNASVTVTPQADVDLVVTKSVDNALPTVGQNVTFTITLGNEGPATATSVTGSDLLPAGMTFVSYAASQGSYNATTGVWNVGTLGANATPVTLTVVAHITATGLLTNTITVSSPQPDPDPSTETASAVVVATPGGNNNVNPNPPSKPSKYSYLGR